MTVAPKREDYDVVVIGAGPAGLAAAATSAEAGLATLLLDENAGPGGQVFRAIASTPVTDRKQLGEYARDEDGDAFCEVHVNTTEGFWSLLRSWLRPHRGISQEKLPAYLGFFQLVHNTRRRGKALLGTLVAGLVAAPVPHHPETR